MIHEITNYVYHLGNTSGLLARNWELLWGLLGNCLNTTQEIGTGHCMGFILGSLWGYLATSLGLLDKQILGDYLRSNKEYLDYLGTT